MADDTTADLLKKLAELGRNANGAVKDYSNHAIEVGKALERKCEAHDALVAKYRALQEVVAISKAPQLAPPVYTLPEPYVVVLVDAHSHRFSLDLLSQEVAGGTIAAQLLVKEAQRWVATHLPTLEHCRTVVRVYADLSGLYDMGDVDLAAFAAGFSRGAASADFVDVADEDFIGVKINAVLEASVEDPRCQSVLLGSHRGAKYMKTVWRPAEIVDEVFSIKSEVVETELVSFRMNRAVSSQVNSTNDTIAGDRFPACTSNKGKIPINPNNHRLDTFKAPLSAADWAHYRAQKNACKFFHLADSCQKTSCPYSHDPIDPTTRACLTVILRREACSDGGACRKKMCFRGHVCREDACRLAGSCQGSCRLPQNMHGIDFTVKMWVVPGMSLRNTSGLRSERSARESSGTSVERASATESGSWTDVELPNEDEGSGAQDDDARVVHDLIDL